MEGAGGVRGVLGDGGQGQGSEALVSVVLGPAVRTEAGAAPSHLVDRPGAGHHQAGGPVGRALLECPGGRQEPVAPLPHTVDRLGVGQHQGRRPVGRVHLGPCRTSSLVGLDHDRSRSWSWR